MRNAFVVDGVHGVTNITMRVDDNIDLTILFIRSREKSFFNRVSGVIVLPIGDSTCPTTHVVVIHSVMLMLWCF